SKRNELGLLSNFAATPFSLKKKHYASIEGFWQSLKYPELKLDERSRLTKEWPFKRSEVEQMTAFEAMNAGKKANEIMSKYHITWISFAGEKIAFKTDKKDIEKHYNIIEMATRAKIDQNPEVKKVLLQTGNLTLRPDHHEDKDGTKAWRYYEIYMKLREELKNNPSKKLLPENWE
ncbi:MAG: NADAR family protein, partial [Bdellovibrionaceae bacterium]|nr:NADAR family protein [Pseudobdellovibrionaceae bacterium]